MQTDKYPNLLALQHRLKLWQHYQVRIFDKLSPVTIVSPHGGFIEPGTSYIAYRIAGWEYNLYDFQGLVAARGREMHVTSVNFHEPRLEDLLKRSHRAISIHCMGVEGTGEIWVGGLNKGLRERIVKELSERGFTVRTDMPRYKGVHSRNFVNLPSQHGVQIEIAGDLMYEFFGDCELFSLQNDVAPKNARLEAFVEGCRAALK